MVRTTGGQVSRIRPLVQYGILLLFGIAVVGIGMLKATDVIVLHWRFDGEKPVAIALPPNSTLSMRSIDFHYTVVTNGIGLRERDLAPEPDPDVFRILCIGDSFTYGWGVPVEKSWVRQLEALLPEIDGRPVQTINAGRPGTSPLGYAKIAETAIPMLRPNLVLVGLLQLNDLVEIHFENLRPEHQLRVGIENAAYRTFPSLWRLAGGASPSGVTFQPVRQGVNEYLAHQRRWAKRKLKRAPEAGRARFDALDETVQRAYRKGMLNPQYLHYLLNREKYYFVEHFYRGNDGDPRVAEAVQEAGRSLARIRALGDRHGACTLAVSIPARDYVDLVGVDRGLHIGMLPDPGEVGSPRPDALFQHGCDLAGVPLIRTMDRIAAENSGGSCYFVHDDHFTAIGHRVLAEALAERIPPKLEACSSLH